MNPRIFAIVEGQGEQSAIPILLRRIAAANDLYVDVPRPIRIPRTRLVKPRELERAVEFVARQGSEEDGILVVLDADRECPAELGPVLLSRARKARSDRNIRVVLAKTEYEAWFLAAAVSIRSCRGLADDLSPPADPEEIRGAKEWLSSRRVGSGSYRETLDQPALTERFDLQEARSASPSFDKLWRDVMDLLMSSRSP